MEEHQKAGLADFEEVQGQVEDKVFSPRMNQATRDYLTKLRKDAFLEIKAGYQDSQAAPGKNTAWSDPAQLTPANRDQRSRAGPDAQEEAAVGDSDSRHHYEVDRHFVVPLSIA